MAIVFLSLASLFYLVPLVRLIRDIFSFIKIWRKRTTKSFSLKLSNFLMHVLAELEYFLSPLRSLVVFLPLLIWLLWLLGHVVSQGLPAGQSPIFAWLLTLNILEFFHQAHQRRTQIRMVEFLRVHPHLHPGTFFDLYKRQMAWGAVDLEHAELQELTLAQADFRHKQRSELKILPFFLSLFDTLTFTRLFLRVCRDVGEAYAREVADAVAIMWGKRLLQHTQACLNVTGLEKLEGKSGHFMLIFNHKSSLDFVYTFFALSEVPVAGRALRPRFIVAKDHFHDNPWIYHVMGIGRTIEVMDMIFIERKNREKGFANLKQAARTVVDRDVDIAIYPQGTRAHGNFDRAGKRRDAGYYTTVSRHNPNAALSHLKKGTGYLVFDILDELRRQGKNEELHLVFVGISGTATSLPKGSLKILTENTVDYVFSDVASFSPSELSAVLRLESPPEEIKQLQDEFARKINHLIDEKLINAIQLHATLRKRFLTDLKGHFRFDEDKIRVIAEGLERFSRDTDVAYKILDRVYSLSMVEWNGYLSQFSQLLMGRLEQPRFEALLEEVTAKLLR